MFNYLIATVCFLAGVLLYCGVTIYNIRRDFPDESSEMKIFRTFWTREWASLLLSGCLLLIYLVILPDIIGRTFYKVEFSTWHRVISTGIGLGSQWIALAAFGRTKKLVTEKFKETNKTDQ